MITEQVICSSVGKITDMSPIIVGCLFCRSQVFSKSHKS